MPFSDYKSLRRDAHERGGKREPRNQKRKAELEEKTDANQPNREKQGKHTGGWRKNEDWELTQKNRGKIKPTDEEQRKKQIHRERGRESWEQKKARDKAEEGRGRCSARSSPEFPSSVFKVQVSSTDDVARPSRHQSFHLRSSRCRSVALFFPHLSFLITLALLPACVSNSRVLLLLLPSRATGLGQWPGRAGWV